MPYNKLITIIGKIYKSFSITLFISIILSSCGLGMSPIRYEMGRAANVKKVAIIDVSLTDPATYVTTAKTWKAYGEIAQLVMKDSVPVFIQNIERQLHWKVTPMNRVLGTPALEKFNKQYEDYMTNNHSMFYGMMTRQSVSLKGMKDIFKIDEKAELKKILLELCQSLKVDGVLMFGFSISHKTKQNSFMGHSRPCVLTSFSLYDKTGTLVVSSDAVKDLDFICSGKEFKMGMGPTGLSIIVTEEMALEMMKLARKSIPVSVGEAKAALDAHRRKQTAKAAEKK